MVCVVIVGELIGGWIGSSTPLALTATAVVAVAFHPLRTMHRIRGRDGRMLGERAVPYEFMTRFGHDLEQALATPDVLARIAETAGRAARARAAHVTTTLPDGRIMGARWPAADSSESFDIVVPVHHDGEVIAEIFVAGAEARLADQALLEQTAAVSAGALRNLRMLAELESLRATIERQNHEIAASSSRLAAAAEEERRRP